MTRQLSVLSDGALGRVNLCLLFALALVIELTVGSGAAQAAPLTPEQKQEMKVHYERATRAYDLQKYAEAIDEYQKAYEIGGDPPMLYNIAQSYRLNDQPAEAIRYYRRYLQRAPDARNRDYVDRKVADLEKQMDDRRKAAAAATPPPVKAPVVTPPPAAPVVTPPPVTPLTAVPPTYLPPAPPPPPSPPVAESSHAGMVVGIAMIGAGVIADGVAIFEGLRAKQKADQITNDSQSKPSKVFDPSVESAGKTANVAAIALGIGGTAVAITGAIILITTNLSSKNADGGTQSARFMFTPWVGAGLVGGGARLQF